MDIVTAQIPAPLAQEIPVKVGSTQVESPLSGVIGRSLLRLQVLPCLPWLPEERWHDSKVSQCHFVSNVCTSCKQTHRCSGISFCSRYTLEKEKNHGSLTSMVYPAHFYPSPDSFHLGMLHTIFPTPLSYHTLHAPPSLPCLTLHALLLLCHTTHPTIPHPVPFQFTVDTMRTYHWPVMLDATMGSRKFAVCKQYWQHQWKQNMSLDSFSLIRIPPSNAL